MAYKVFNNLLKESPPPEHADVPRVHIKISSTTTKRRRDPNVFIKGKEKKAKTFDELKVLANQTEQNIINAITQLKQQLQRMDGRVILEDHDRKGIDKHSNMSYHYTQYSLDPNIIKMELVRKGQLVLDEGEESDESY